MTSPESGSECCDPGPAVSRRRWGLMLWPSFLAACLLEGLVFAIVDPAELRWPGDVGSPSNRAVYTTAFFVFWFVILSCCRTVLWLAGSSTNSRFNDRPGD